jgi:hypothetical protein
MASVASGKPWLPWKIIGKIYREDPKKDLKQSKF